MENEGLILDVTPAEGDFDRAFLEKLGHPVLVCHGPDWGKACPVIKGDCAMVESAHGVVFQLDLDRPQHRVILKRYQEILPEDTPITAVVRHDQRVRYAELLRNVHVLEHEPTAADLDGLAAEVEAVDADR